MIHSALRLAIQTLIYLSILPSSLIADEHWETSRERLADAYGWEELCAIKDCDQFPKGYATWAIGGELYYFPLYSTLTERPLERYSVQTGRFYEVDENDELLRSFGYTDRLRLSDCCHYLLSFYGLADLLPAFNEETGNNRMPPSRVYLTKYDNYFLRDNRIQRHLGASLLNRTEMPIFEEIIPDDLTSYSDDFWLIRTYIDEHNLGAWFTLISKQPLMNGRHVVVRCGQLCDIHTVSFAKDDGNRTPHISVNWIRLKPGALYSCHTKGAHRFCTLAPDLLDQVPNILSVLEQMFDAASTFPTKVE